jgi:hypothetical protein
MTLSIPEKIIGLILILLMGFGSGWYTHGKFDQADQAEQLKTQVDAANKAADGRVAQEQAVNADTTAKLASEQAKTADLNKQLDGLRADNDALHRSIADAHFTPTSRPLPQRAGNEPVASCPGHSVSSPEFLQLYNAAAKGRTPGGKTGDPGAS